MQRSKDCCTPEPSNDISLCDDNKESLSLSSFYVVLLYGPLLLKVLFSPVPHCTSSWSIVSELSLPSQNSQSSRPVFPLSYCIYVVYVWTGIGQFFLYFGACDNKGLFYSIHLHLHLFNFIGWQNNCDE